MFGSLYSFARADTTLGSAFLWKYEGELPPLQMHPALSRSQCKTVRRADAERRRRAAAAGGGGAQGAGGGAAGPGAAPTAAPAPAPAGGQEARVATAARGAAGGGRLLPAHRRQRLPHRLLGRAAASVALQLLLAAHLRRHVLLDSEHPLRGDAAGRAVLQLVLGAAGPARHAAADGAAQRAGLAAARPRQGPRRAARRTRRLRVRRRARRAAHAGVPGRDVGAARARHAGGVADGELLAGDPGGVHAGQLAGVAHGGLDQHGAAAGRARRRLAGAREPRLAGAKRPPRASPARPHLAARRPLRRPPRGGGGAAGDGVAHARRAGVAGGGGALGQGAAVAAADVPAAARLPAGADRQPGEHDADLLGHVHAHLLLGGPDPRGGRDGRGGRGRRVRRGGADGGGAAGRGGAGVRAAAVAGPPPHGRGPGEAPALVACLLLYIAANTAGFFVLPIVATGELLPARVRGIAGGYIYFFFNLVLFAVAKLFPLAVRAVGVSGVFWAFGAFSLLGTVLMYLAVPETKGRTLNQVEDYFDGENALWVTRRKGAEFSDRRAAYKV
ncbi:spidroin-1-like [Schistocerca gregaria]|uniref:spidroin-1-like n=1 Tax=Schistocerca gregaria TaxID=7010 RepID=UPI00211DB5EF|nr:spidroin-1-like [Schistocerca gregaria]